MPLEPLGSIKNTIIHKMIYYEKCQIDYIRDKSRLNSRNNAFLLSSANIFHTDIIKDELQKSHSKYL